MTVRGPTLGLDLARRFGWAVVNANGQYVTSGCGDLRVSAGRGERIHALHLRLADLVTTYNPDWIAIEAPIHQTSFPAARALFAYCGMAEMVAFVREIGFAEFSRTQYCKAILGNAKASKADGVEFVRRFKPLLNSDDEADSVLVALYAHQCRSNGS